ncbi:hypothetical protein D910_03945 [Dendroctonus ponderosae]|uniref:Uncharacterized protein n=1 Tax=Dendroctonus ponderosae TaxID=77166 RepID=U4TY45_DENPD|nr:hypothetical protein D910_03945 [Dendroctonus ponderosae]
MAKIRNFCGLESSHQSHRDSRFVYGRYRQPPTRILHPVPYRQPEEEGIYESADHERGSAGCQDTPDSESANPTDCATFSFSSE